MRNLVTLCCARRAGAACLALLCSGFMAACGGSDGNHAATASPSLDSRTLTVATSDAATVAAGLCAAQETASANRVESADLVEISGIAASRKHGGVLWAHNDSGDSARVFAMSRAGEHLGAFTLDGAEAIDWEDMAIGQGPEGQDYLYLGDIGDNGAQRSEIVVYRVPEPETGAPGAPLEETLEGVEKFVLRYPDRAHDAEVLLVDPEMQEIVVVTKEIATGVSSVFRAPSLSGNAAITMEAAGVVDFKALRAATQPPEDASALVRGVGYLPTGGDVSVDGSIVMIRTYGSVWVWPRSPGASLSDAFRNTPCEAPSAIEPQGEAIAIAADGGGFTTISEGERQPIHHFAR